MNEYLALPLVGAVVSVLVQFIKSSSPTTSRLWPMSAVVVLSVLSGAAYYQFGHTALWDACLQVLLYANAVYAFLIKPFQQ